MEVKDTDFFVKSPTGTIPNFGALSPINDFAFASKKGALSYVVKTKVRGGDGYSVFMLRDIEPEGITPLSEAEPVIRGMLVKKKQDALALDAARSFRGRVNNSDQFVADATRQGLKIDTTGEKSQRDFVPAFGSDESITKKLLSLNTGQVSEAMKCSKGGVVAILLNKTAARYCRIQCQER